MPRVNNRLLAYLLLLLNTALWGFSVPIIKNSLQFVSPSLFLFYRYLLATAIFLPVFLFYRSRTRRHINHLQTFFLALLGTPICLLPLFYGLSQTSAIEASIIESTSPLFTVILCYFFLKEKVTATERKGLFIALLGTALITVEPLLSNPSQVQLSLTGNFLILLSNLIWPLFLMLSKKFKPDPIYLSFYSFAVSIPFFFFLSSPHLQPLPSLPAWWGLLYMALGGSVIAFWVYQEGQKRIEASEAALFTYLKPLFAIPLSILWLKETFSPLAIIATLVIVVGVFIAEKR